MIDLKDYGFIPAYMPNDAKGIPARVTAVFKERYELICEHGRIYGKLKPGVYFNSGSENFPTTGDFVIIEYNAQGDSLINKTLNRTSLFARLDPTPGRGEQAVAANFDYVFILSSLNQDFNARRIERYVALTWQSGAIPVVILTKADLTDDCSEQIYAAQGSAIGVNVHVVSSKEGHGLNELNQYLQPGKTIVFLGSSGVGKSSLLNALAEEEIMAVNTIRENDSKGRHTTTHRQLIMLKNGAMIIDTPGMRELGMWDAESGLSETFSDIESYFGKCRFSDCSHQSEPGCAVKESIKNGELSQERFDSYLKLKKESKFSDDKAAAMKAKQEWAKSISKINKLYKKSQKEQ